MGSMGRWLDFQKSTEHAFGIFPVVAIKTKHGLVPLFSTAWVLVLCAGAALASLYLGPLLPSVVHLYGLPLSCLPWGFESFATILDASTSDKAYTHHFSQMYAEYLDPLRLQGTPVNLLEIGVAQGDSLKLWPKAFPRGRLYGMDISEYAKGFEALPEVQGRLKMFIGNQSDPKVLEQVASAIRAEVGELDFLIDDGGHTMAQQITTFTHLFPLVKPGGVYFIEDMQSSYYAEIDPWDYGGGAPGKNGTMIALVKSLIDVINNDYHEDHKPNNGGECLGTGVYNVNPADKYVASVQCWRNMCALRRKRKDSHF